MATNGEEDGPGLDGALSSRQHRGGWDPREVGEYPQGREEERTGREARRGELDGKKAASLSDSGLFLALWRVTLSRLCNISYIWEMFESVLRFVRQV